MQGECCSEKALDWEFVEQVRSSLNKDEETSVGETTRRSTFGGGGGGIAVLPTKTNAGYASDDATSEVTLDQLKEFREHFAASASGRVAQNAVAAASLEKVALSRDVLLKVPQHNFSVNVDRGGMPVTNQKNSGRCWLFGTLNLFRFGTRDKLRLDYFEFSESYLYFFHLLEQVNSFLEFIIATAKDPLDDRVVSQLLDGPIYDGGDWGIAVNLLQKYGIVPKSVYPETESSSDTDELTMVLTKRLRHVACRIRQSLSNGSSCSPEVVRATLKAECVASAYRILCIHLGPPPLTFDWQWRDEMGDFNRLNDMTPLQFCKEYVTVPFATSYVSLIQDPRHDYYSRYTVDYSTTVCGGQPMVFLNVPALGMKRMARQMLQDGRPVWFACNVEVECDNEHGVWDAHLYDLAGLYDLADPQMTKKDRIEYGGNMGDHVMLMTGVDVGDDDRPRCWRVENSWGTDDAGDNGYYAMSDNWFDANVFEIVVPSEYLNAEESAGLKTKPIVLPAWDAMCCSRRRGMTGNGMRKR